MIKFKRDKETGRLLVYKDGKLIGEVITMGDLIMEQAEGEKNEVKYSSRRKDHEQRS